MSLLSSLLTPITSDSNDKGYFANPTALNAAYPVGEAGWFAIVGSTDTVWVWDTGTNAWVDTGNSTPGDVVGPSSSTDNAITRFDGTTGKLIQNSGVLISDSNNITGVAKISGTNALFSALAAGAATNSPIIYTDTSGNLTADIADLTWDDTNKRLGVNQQGLTPSGTLDVHSSTLTVPIAQFNQTGTQGSTNGAIVQLQADSGAALGSGNRLGALQFTAAYNASSNTNIGATIHALATQLWTASANGTKLEFYTTANNASSRTLALTLGQDQSATFAGNVNITNLTASQAVVTDASKNLTSLAYSSTPSASILPIWDTNSNLGANSLISNLTATTGAGQTISMTFASSPTQVHNTGGNITYTLPTLTGLSGSRSFTYVFYNNTSANVTTINSSGGNLVASLVSGQYAIITNILTSGTTAASWIATVSSALAVSSSVAKRDSSAGLSAAYFATLSNIATTGAIRLQSTDTIAWRNNANNANIALSKNTNEIFSLGSAFQATSISNGYTSTATAAGTTTLTATSTGVQDFTGTTTQTVVMPVVSTLLTGMRWQINNYSSGNVTVQSSGGNTIITLSANQSFMLWVKSVSGTGTASWGWTAAQTLAG